MEKSSSYREFEANSPELREKKQFSSYSEHFRKICQVKTEQYFQIFKSQLNAT